MNCDVSFKVSNIVGTGELPVELALDPLSEDLEGNTWSAGQNQPGLYHKFKDGGPVSTLYRKGKYIIRGAETVQELNEAEERLQTALGELGIIEPHIDTGFEINNVVASGDIDRQINLVALCVELGLEKTMYEPEDFPALVYRNSDYSSTFLVFSTGKIVSVGGSDVEEIEDDVYTFVESELEPFLNKVQMA
jgi:transcription initiation factor TFIID TATA-box-binding protein